MAAAQHCRIGVARQDSTRWTKNSTADTCLVVELPTSLPIAETISHLWNTTEPPAGLKLYCCGNCLIIDQSHAVLDGRMSTKLLEAVLHDDTTAGWIRNPQPHPHLARAAATFFCGHPTRLIRLTQDVMRSRARRAASKQVNATPTTSTETARHVATTVVPAPQLLQLRQWRDIHAQTASMTVVLTCALARSLTAAGIDFDSSVHLLVDGRRYTPRAEQFSGNFTVGLNFHLTAPFDPIDLSAQLTGALNAGRPLAAMTAISVLTTLSRRRMLGTSTHKVDRPVLSVSDLGRADLSTADWRDGPRHYIGTTNTHGPNGISVLMVQRCGEYEISASFDEHVHSPALVHRALQQLRRLPEHEPANPEVQL